LLTGVVDAAAARQLEGDRRPDLVASDPRGVAELLGVPLS
jgi:hypothetical protein